MRLFCLKKLISDNIFTVNKFSIIILIFVRQHSAERTSLGLFHKHDIRDRKVKYVKFTSIFTSKHAGDEVKKPVKKLVTNSACR